MGFYLGILMKSPPHRGGVHKLIILLRDLLKEVIQTIFGEEMGGVRGTQTPLSKNKSLLGPQKGINKEHCVFFFFFSFFCKTSGSKQQVLGFSRGSWRV